MTPAPSLRGARLLRHSAVVRLTHWLTLIAFVALLLSGIEIFISHPRLYWGEVGNSGTRAWFQLPIPASRATVPTGYSYVLPDQNGWSRYLHFEAAWLVVLCGAVYGVAGLWSGHFRHDLMPARTDRTWRALRRAMTEHLHFVRRDDSEAYAYNLMQRLAYLAVIFVLFPLVIWTGLAMSPAFDAAVPAAVNALGGRQSARTLHFLVSGSLVLFVVMHVAMVALAGFRSRMRAMITGRVHPPQEGA